MNNIAKMERAAMLAAVLGIILGFIGAGLSDGTGRWKVIYILLAIAFALFAVFFIIVATIKAKEKRCADFEEAEEVVIPEEYSLSHCVTAPSEKEPGFSFTNDRYDFLSGYGEVGEK